MAYDMTNPSDVYKYLQSVGGLANPVTPSAPPTPAPAAQPKPSYSAPQSSPVPAPSYGFPSAPSTPSYGVPSPPKDMSGYKPQTPMLGMPPAAPNPVPAPAPTSAPNSTGGVSGQLTPQQAQILNSLPPEARHNYLLSLAGLPPSSTPGMPMNGSQAPRPNVPTVPAPMTPEQIRAEVAAKIAAETAKRTTAANQAKTGIQTSYNRLRSTTNDTRTLENVQNARNLNPFSGRSDFAQGMIGRERAISDRQQSEDLQTRLANIDVSLKDYLDATPEQQRAMENELTRQERDYALKVDQIGYQRQRDATSDTRYDNETAYNRGQDQIKNAITESGVTGDYDPYASQKQQMQKNSAAWANASPAEKQRLAAENQKIGASIGAKQDANGDWIYPQPIRTVQGKAADAQSKIIQQQLTSGEISNETAKFKLDQLKDPNSPVNQAAQIDLQLKQMDLANAPIESRLKIEQLKKQIAQIGAAPYKSEADKQLDQVKLDTAKETLKQLQSGTKSTEINQFVDNLRALYTAKDPDTGEIKVSNPQALRNAIIAKGMTDDKTDEMLLMFGLPTN